jgi:hypothetical protein
MNRFSAALNTALQLFTASGLTPLKGYESATIWLPKENISSITG